MTFLHKFNQNLQYYLRKFTSYRLFTYASSASFFIITALLPLIMLTLSIISFTNFSQQEFMDMVGQVIPDSFAPLLSRIIGELSTSSTSSGVTALSISVVTLLWSASKSVLGLMDGLNAIADVQDFRNYFLKRVVCILYMLLLIIGLIATLGLRVFGQTILSHLENRTPHLAKIFAMILGFRGLTLIVVVTVIITIIYTAFPNKKMRLPLQIPGAVFSSLAWIAFSEVYSFYVDHFSSFSTIYGSIGMVVLAMIWLYFCISIVFIGAVINQLYPSVYWRVLVVLKYRRIYRQQRAEARREIKKEQARQKLEQKNHKK